MKPKNSSPAAPWGLEAKVESDLLMVGKMLKMRAF